MSFDKETRNLLARTVGTCRRRLVDDVTDQLRGMYGLHPDGTVLPIEQLTHLSPDQATAASRLRDLQEHYAAGAAVADGDRRKAAFERMTLEIAFTALNRLAALRLCEERGLVVECVRKGMASDGFQMFERISGGALGGRFDTYRVFLECLFDELALDLGVLFDRTTPQSAIFPTERCVEDVLTELNKEELSHLWTEDETIGWVYQYFNPPEERRAMRDASQAPRNSRELAVRNQFFTPRYVVEFLTDNTLGRIWYEMRKGDTALKDECRFLVRRPNEIFLAPGESAPAVEVSETELSQEELLKKPVYIEHRPKKDPRDLRVLDPACGSGHFLLYAFDLLERIYGEAWADPEGPPAKSTGRSLREEFQTLEELRRAAPKLIIEHNLHGIDIDPRAVQIAALALWLRAQKTWKRLGVRPSERPRITKSNIVTAEPMPGEDDMLREFTASLKPRVLGQLVEVIFEKMKLASEAGALLKIEEEIKDAVAEARKQWAEGPKLEQSELFPELVRVKPEQQQFHFDLSEVTDEQFWQQAEDRILAALNEYAEGMENGHGTGRRLFAEDAARGFAFIALCRKHYHVVLMNPPFGEPASNTKYLLSRRYRQSKNDIFAAFIHFGLQVLFQGGSLGAITSRTGFFLAAFEEWRSTILLGLGRPIAVCDLGNGVLDTATVETAAYVFARDSQVSSAPFIRLLESNQKASGLLEELSEIRVGSLGRLTSLCTPDSLRSLPGVPFAYWVTPKVRRLFKHWPLIGEACFVDMGMSTKNDDRFVRLRWEVDPLAIGWDAQFRPYAKGGSSDAAYVPIDCVVLAHQDFRELRVDLCQKYPYLDGNTDWVLHPEYHYGQAGLAFGRRVRRFRPLPLPRGIMFSDSNPTLFPPQADDVYWLAGYLSARVVQCLLGLFAPPRKMEVGYIEKLPFPSPNEIAKAKLEEFGRAIFARGMKRIASEETDGRFSKPLSIAEPSTGDAMGDFADEELESLVGNVLELGNDSSVMLSTFSAATGLSEDGDWRGVEESGGGDYEGEATGPSERKVRDVLSYCVGVAFGRWDIRVGREPSLAPPLTDPFAPLPVCPPGMLVGPDGLPAEPNRIVSEEWLRARPDANTLPPEGSVKSPIISDSEYPLRINWDGILVDDLGFSGTPMHRDDIAQRVREVLDVICKERAHDIEQEACEILGISDLREYFRKPAGYFQDHLKRYSKSRRKAPIYWPLSTSSGSYTIWIYYHRLTDQTLYKAVNLYVEPKIAEVERGVARFEEELRSASGRETARLTDRLSEARGFLGELRDFREELLRIAALPYRPNLNDGVIINAAPFHKLFRLRSWAKDTEECWESLAKGEYDWAHLAYTIWPDRVREVCKRDRSIAIAHGLEELCETPAPGARKRTSGRGKRKAAAAEEES